jgi:hypothetical protein
VELNNTGGNVVKLSASWEDKPLAERRQAGKIASTSLSERLNLMILLPAGLLKQADNNP